MGGGAVVGGRGRVGTFLIAGVRLKTYKLRKLEKILSIKTLIIIIYFAFSRLWGQRFVRHSLKIQLVIGVNPAMFLVGFTSRMPFRTQPSRSEAIISSKTFRCAMDRTFGK